VSKAVKRSRKIAAAFATGVTEAGGHGIAKNGEDSMYRLLKRILPQVKSFGEVLMPWQVYQSFI
jgi:hypothetical protein